MIFDLLENCGAYGFPDIPQIAAGFKFLRNFDPSTPDGRVEMQGDGLYALVQTFLNEDPSRRRFEAHREHIDIQCVFRGSERIFVEPVARLTAATEYDARNDIIFYRDIAAPSALVLRPGAFALFHPQDAHKPCCIADMAGPVRKVAVKIHVRPAA